VHRSPRRAAAALAISLLLAACGSDLPRGAVATVDGEVIASDTLEEWVRTATTANPGLRAADVQADLLSRTIQNRLVLAALAARGLAVTPEAIAAVDADVQEQLGGPERLAATLIDVGFPRDFYEQVFLVTEAAIDVLVDALVADVVLETRTARHILVETAEEADELVALLADGADFATLAAERSTDPGSAAQGGSLGASERGRFVPEFDEAVWSARLGVVLPPVQTQFGFHVIEVVDQARTPASELSGQQRRQLADEELSGILGSAVSSAVVLIAPRIGTWDGESGYVVLPVGSGTGDR